MNRPLQRCASALPVLVLAALLASCGGEPPPPPRTSSLHEARTAEAAKAAEAATAAAEETTVAAPTPDAETADGDAAGASPDAPPTVASAAAAAAAAEPVSLPDGPAPAPGVDYFLIDPPQPLTTIPGKVEIAEVFSYTCIHCARLQGLTPSWIEKLPGQVEFVRVPMAHGAFEPIARGFYAAQAMGALEQTHRGMFKALAEDQKLGSGRIDDIARIYGSLGVDPEALKSTARSFSVNTWISRNQRATARWGIEGTPTIVVAGKYRVPVLAGSGFDGMLRTADWLARKEIIQAQQQAAGEPE